MPLTSKHVPRRPASRGGGEPRLIGGATGGMTGKRPVVCDRQGRPVGFPPEEGQCSHFTGADALLRDLPPATALMGDRGDDSNPVRTMLSEQGIPPRIPPRRNRKRPIDCRKRLDNMGHTVENLLARLKDWCPIATGYNCCARVFRAAVPLGPPSSSGYPAASPEPGLAPSRSAVAPVLIEAGAMPDGIVCAKIHKLTI